MKLKNTVLVVKNLEQSKRFYRDVLGLHVLMDVGPYVTLTNGIPPAKPGELGKRPVSSKGSGILWGAGRGAVF